MLDLSHIPNSQQDIQIFNAISGSNSWQTWQKPRKCNYVYIMCIGGAGGGGGGAGYNNAFSTGGGSGGVSRALYNAQQLPDRLYVQVGVGGAGGIIGTPGSAGTRSWVSLLPAVTTQNLVQGSGGNVAAGGTVATGTSAVGETVITQTTVTFFTLSNFIGTAGITATGIGVTQASNITPLSSQITCPGAGGSTVSFSNTGQDGGSILSSALNPLIPGGIGATASGSNATNGADGITSWKPFFSTGGAGGGSAVSGSGGNGGNGGIGSGGGGAGAAISPFPAGRGGKGGDGLVIITTIF